MPPKTIIGQDAAQVGIAVEQHAVHVVYFALEPAGDRPHARHRRHRRHFVCRDVDADAVVLGEAQQAIDHLEPLGAIRIIDAGDFHQLLIGELIVQDRQRFDHRLTTDVQRIFADAFADLDQPIAERGGQSIAQPFGHDEAGKGVRYDAHRSNVPTRRIFRCNCITP